MYNVKNFMYYFITCYSFLILFQTLLYYLFLYFLLFFFFRNNLVVELAGLR